MSGKKPKARSGWKPSIAIWLAVLGLTVATAFYFKSATPDAPLSGVSLTFVGFFWFVVAVGAKWLRVYFKDRDAKP